MVTTEFDNAKMLHSSANRKVITDFETGTVKFINRGCEIASYDFGNLSLDDYQILISDFFPGQSIANTNEVRY